MNAHQRRLELSTSRRIAFLALIVLAIMALVEAAMGTH